MGKTPSGGTPRIVKTDRLKFLVILIIILTITAYAISSLLSYAGEDVARIKIKGIILTDRANIYGTDVTSSKAIVQFIEEADEDPGIKAILFEINSGGGSAVASKEIADAIKRTKKPTVSLIREVGASGAYWIASATDTIIANDLSITGSIGVISSYLEFSGFLDKYNVTHQRLVAGKYKDIGTPFRELTDEEEMMLQKQLDKIHEYFIREVAENRKLDIEQVRNISTGMFHLGVDAKDYGLVDMLGDMKTAEDFLKKELNVTEINYADYEEHVSLIEALQGVSLKQSILNSGISVQYNG